MKNFSVLIIGYGSIGSRHAKNLLKLGINDICVFRTYKNISKYPISKKLKIFNNFKEALNYKRYNLIIISNPTSEHVRYALKCIKKKINLYIEKPLSNSLKNINKLKNLSIKYNTKIFIGCQLRFNPGLIFIKKIIEKKILGKVYSVSSDVGEYLPNWHPSENYKLSYASKKKLGGGVILTLIHEIDYLYWLFGQFKNVYAIGGKVTNLIINVEDTVVSSILTKKNIPIMLRMDYWRTPPSRTLNIVCEKGQLFWDFYKKEAKILYNNGKEIIKKLPKNWNKNDMYLNTLRNYIMCIAQKKKSEIPLQDGVYALKVALSMKKSLKLNKKILV